MDTDVRAALPRVTPEQLSRFEGMLLEDGHGHADRYVFTQRDFFGDLDLAGTHALEIGSGRGLTSVYLALAGAERVVSMEPGLAGASSSVRDTLEHRIAALGLPQIELEAADFNTWEAAGRQFDVLVSQSSINHLQESPFNARTHRETYQRYLIAARKMHDLLRPGGVACVSDACRYGLFFFLSRFGVRPPWSNRVLTVNWRIHQNPGTWARIFRDAGFSRVEATYPLPYRMRRLAPVVRNPVANFCLQGSFILRAWR